MKTNLRFATAQDTIRKVAMVMRDDELGFLPVVDSAHQVIGVITDRDLVVRGLADGISDDAAVSELMTSSVIVCAPDDDVLVAAERLAQMRRSRIVVLNDSGRLVGVISLSDLIDVLDHNDALATMQEVITRQDAPTLA